MGRYIGTKIGSSVDTCGLTPSTDDVLCVDPADATKAKYQKAQTANVADSAITTAKIIDNAITGAKAAVLKSLGVFGDGSDLARTFDGSTTILGMAPASSVYTMTRDIHLADGSAINTGVTINPAGHRLTCNGTITLNGTASISSKSAKAPSGSGATGGSGSSAIPTSPTIGGTLYGGTSGGTGGAIGANGTGAGNVGASDANTSFAGGAGSAGGTGKTSESGAHTGGSGGTGGTITTASKESLGHFGIGFMQRDIYATQSGMIQGGYSGAGGGGGGGSTSGAGGGGGAGGRGGSCLSIAFDTLVLSSWTGTISADGGDGGDGGSGAGGLGTHGGGGGGGGGGGAGFVFIMCRIVSGGTLTASPTLPGGATVGGANVTANGGAAGAAGGGGTGGTAAVAGSNGRVTLLVG